MDRQTRVRRLRRRRRLPILLALAGLLVGVLAAGFSASAAPHPAPYFNGFEDAGDASGAGDDTMFNVMRVASGTNGVPSAAGSWHAEAPVDHFGDSGQFTFTRLGGFNDVFPAEGYTVTIDVYLDMALSHSGNDLRFDWSSAVNDPAGNHRRDFIFSVGTDGAGGWVMSASNNAPGWPANPARDPLTVTETGWYTLHHSFYDDGTGVLAVDMSVRDASGAVLETWTLSDASDVIGTTVGGNRYGWLVTNDFADLPLDNVTRSGNVAEAKADCKKGGWETHFRADGSGFKNQGDCIQYVNTGK